MNKKIAILRGINVGGKRIILMNDLKAVCEGLNLKNVKTYIQSGNLIFDSEKTILALENELEKAIEDQFGFDVAVIVRSAAELKDSIVKNPFYEEGGDVSKLHLTFLKEKPTKEKEDEVLTCNFDPDKLKLEGRDVYIYCDGKYHQSKLTNTFFEKKLGTTATTRNWKTVLKLVELTEK